MLLCSSVAKVQFSLVLHLFLRTENWTDDLQAELRTEQDWTGKNHSSLSSSVQFSVQTAKLAKIGQEVGTFPTIHQW